MDCYESMIVSTSSNDENKEIAVKLIQSTYWGLERSREMILKSMENSICFYLVIDEKLIGISRVISDLATFAYLCDVVIAKEYRGTGYAKVLLKSLLGHSEFVDVNWLLRTKDAHSLYEHFGFIKTFRPDRYMEKQIKF